MPSFRRLLLALALPFLVSACAPVLRNLSVPEQPEGVPLTAQAEIKPWQATLRGGLMMSVQPVSPTGEALAPASPAGQLLTTGQVSTDGFQRREGVVQGTPRYGMAQLSATQEYTTTGLGASSVGISTRFMVDAPASCFGFDNGAAAWTQRGVLRADGSPWLFNGDPLTYRIDGPASWQNFVNWPAPSTSAASNFGAREGAGALAPTSSGQPRGALHLLVRAQWPIGPTPVVPEVKTYWRVDFESPDLSAQAPWQAAGRVSLRVAARAAGFQVLPSLVVAAPGSNARTTLLPANLATPAPVAGGDAWDFVEARFEKPAGATVVGVRVSVYGETDHLSGARNRLNSVYVDAVCALP